MVAHIGLMTMTRAETVKKVRRRAVRRRFQQERRRLRADIRRQRAELQATIAAADAQELAEQARRNGRREDRGLSLPAGGIPDVGLRCHPRSALRSIFIRVVRGNSASTSITAGTL